MLAWLERAGDRTRRLLRGAPMSVGGGASRARMAARSLVTASSLLAAVSLAAVMAGACVSTAHAQERRIEVQLFLPPASGGSTFTIARPDIPSHLNAVFGIGASYSLGSFVRSETLADGSVVGASVVPHHLQLEAMAALGLFEFLELGVVLPVSLNSAATDALAPTLTYNFNAGLSDLRLEAKIPLVRGEFGLAIRFVAQLPTATSEDFLGADYWIATPTLALAWNPGPIIVASELGYRFRQRRELPGFEQDDEIHASLGLAVPILDELHAIAETQARIGVGGRTLEANEIPWEADAGVRIWPVPGLSIELGVGTGILAGYGAPTVRGYASVRFATDQGEGCAFGPEDFDGFEDGDFCADPDNDGDGLLDAVDGCANDSEDVDRFLDDDGCPDTDNDADGVVDADDACPTLSEDRDGFQDDDGCPEPDNDEDGVADGVDQCPMEPEDRDDYQDSDGCPEPGPEAASVTVTDTRILISEHIYFDYDRDTIRSVSTPMLDQVAEVIRELPEHLRVRVDGYTDNEGVAAYNLDLSYRRARAVVEYLVGRGVPRGRIDYRGYGPENPVAPNDSPEGRALNRRVEFTILNEGESAGRRR
ncbi:MAG: OmpA family protein [Sandaracinaceae bacterium]